MWERQKSLIIVYSNNEVCCCLTVPLTSNNSRCLISCILMARCRYIQEETPNIRNDSLFSSLYSYWSFSQEGSAPAASSGSGGAGGVAGGRGLSTSEGKARSAAMACIEVWIKLGYFVCEVCDGLWCNMKWIFPSKSYSSNMYMHDMWHVHVTCHMC